VAGSILIVAGIGGILTSWNAMFLGATRILFAMGRAKMLPPVFAKTNTKGAPVAAIILTGGFGMIAPFLGKNALGWFVDASSLGTVVAYLCVAISFIKLRHQEPNLERPWKAKRHRVIGILSLLACIFYISIYLPFGSSALGVHEWMMVGLWAFIGIIMYVSNIRQNRTITILDRETMIFGSHFSRKIVKDEPNAHLDSDIA
jgi:amino acid transporter